MSTATQELNTQEQPVIVIRPGEDETWSPMFLGVKRAKAVIDHLAAIRAFVAAHETTV